eukprot:TRINITY_DN575_c13_g1_i1.p1 TRINITY_DN575_c13_g1~~TRINITY_DN575_c13_g1_i1.p1  ORF type:complete len:458 (+),score=156.03 TRINITY_DN575_c13_g1_i1:89-1462(+)
MWKAQRGTVIAGKYRVSAEAGRGSFARVLRCEEVATRKAVAVKVLERQYARDAMREIDVLRAVNRHDPDGKHHVVKMLGSFQWEGMHCMVFGLHGQSLRQRKFGQRDRAQVAQLAKQVAAALQFLHVNCRVIHTDLKPENILLERADEPGAGIGSRFVVCDLGSASFYSERADTELITTRPYRAPEVLVCCGWSWGADNFSLGCILFEVFTGQTLFECARYSDSDEQHIQAMERRLGAVPSWLSGAASGRGRGLMHQLTAGRRWAPSPFSAADRSAAAPFTDRLSGDKDLADMLLRLLDYDTHQRLRSDEIPHHPFVSAHCGRPTSGLAKYPNSAYTAGSIVCAPGGRTAARPPADRVRSATSTAVRSTPAASAEPVRPPRSSSARPGMKMRELPLRDISNRLPAIRDDEKYQPHTARYPRPSAPAAPEPARPRSGSLSRGAYGWTRSSVPSSRILW